MHWREGVVFIVIKLKNKVYQIVVNMINNFNRVNSVEKSGEVKCLSISQSESLTGIFMKTCLLFGYAHNTDYIY